MDENLLTIDKIIKKARLMGASFGHGDPKVHLAYLTKLRILPQSIRRKVQGKIQGCYPESVVSTILKAEELKNSGLTYSQVRWQLTNPILPNYNYSLLNQGLLLIVGLLLGFLVGTGQLKAPAFDLENKVALSSSRIDNDVRTYIKLMSDGNAGRVNRDVYLIAVPNFENGNLYRVGKINIENLVR